MTKLHLPKNLYNDVYQLFDSIPEAVIIYNSESRVLLMNKTACKNLRIKAEEWIGKTPEQYVKEGYVDRSVVSEALKNKRFSQGFIHTRDGSEFFSSCNPIFGADGSVKYIVVTTTSVKEVNQLKEKLETERFKIEKYRLEIEHLRKSITVANEYIFQKHNVHGLFEFVGKVGPLDCTVLLMGESGVGKEVLAKAIHTNSPRNDMPFIPVSIPAIPEGLLEAELFGYEEGAFTGSKRGGKIGLFEMAQGGTLFLDEVGDIPFNIQVKLLRTIETSEIIRVGGTKSKRLDVRIISATNKDLASEVKRGLFREDLFYRLNVVPFIIHPLRERRDAIIPLCLNFLQSNNMKYRLNKEFSPDSLEELKNYRWPGNIRELKNVVERLAIFSDSQTISAADVREILFSDISTAPLKDKDAPLSEKTSGNHINGPILNQYETYEQERILDALKEAGGNKVKAAHIMGISRNKLYRKLKQHS